MAVTLNANTSTGFIATSDTSGVLQLQTAGTTALTVDASQNVTLANGTTIQGLTVGRGAGAVSTNTAVGASALAANTTGATATAVGYQAGYSNTTGIRNVFVGEGAGYSNTTSGESTYVGRYAGRLATGASNTFIGEEAGGSVTTGTLNSFLGTYAGADMTTGSKNTIVGRFLGNQGGLDIRTASNYIVLSDGDGNPRGLFDGSGNFMVNRTTSSAKLSASASSGDIFDLFTSGTATGYIYNSQSTSTSNAAYFIKNGVEVGRISCTSSATSYVTSSDYRLKNTVASMTGALDKVAQLKPVTYKWNVDGSDGQGFIAHELAEVCPDAVVGEKDAVNEDGSIKAQGIDTSFLVATLTAAIQEQQAIIQTLTDRITALEGTTP